VDLNQKYAKNAIRCKNTGLLHFNLEAIIYYKIVKYFSKGVVHSYEQLFKLKKILNSLDSQDLNKILNLTEKNLPHENFFIKKLVEDDFENFEKNEWIKKFWINKRIMRQKKRLVFGGKLKIVNLFKSKKFLYAFLFGSLAKWPKNHKPMPAIAIIGNDGAGKTKICDYVIKNFSKMDPAVLNMRSDTSIIFLTKYLKKYIKKIINFSLINKFLPIKNFFLFLGQSIDLFDKYIRYKIGMAFADSGFGITIFERYITDKLRGEFPNKKNRFLPLEQFFPFPDGLAYLDVEPKVSIERKVKDNHTLDEMTCKRENYLSLLEEFNEVRKFSYTNSFEQNVKELKNYIFKLAIKKQKILKSTHSFTRCRWEKNKKRVLAGSTINRFQKDSFL
jgi:thymidylate kinase